MKKTWLAPSLLIPGLLGLQGAPAQAGFDLGDYPYVLSKRAQLYDVVLEAKIADQFSEQELAELQGVELIPVRGNSQVFAVPVPVVAATDWKETTYGINLAVTERLVKLCLQLLDSNIAYGATLLEKIRTGTLTPNDPELKKINEDMTDAWKNEFVASAKVAAALTPLDPTLITKFDEALLFVSDALRILPVVRASVNVGYGYSLARAAAFKKASNLLPQYKLIRYIPTESVLMDTTAEAGKSLFKPTSEEAKRSQSQVESMRRLQSKLSQDLVGQVIKSSGTTLGLDFYPNLVFGWGMDSSDPYKGAGVFGIIGNFESKFPVSFQLNGRIDCRFSAHIRDGYIFEVESNTAQEGGFIDMSHRIDRAGEEQEVNCQFTDEKGRILNSQGKVTAADFPDAPQPEMAANQVNSVLDGQILAFKKKSSDAYEATLSLKKAIVQAAIEAKNGWKALPVPMQRIDIERWQSAPDSCERIPHVIKSGSCKTVYSLKYPLGKRSCTDDVVEYNEICKPVQFKVHETLEQPMKIYYPGPREVSFDRYLTDTMTIEVHSNQTQYVPVSHGSDVCIAREEIADPSPNRKALYTNCDATHQKDFHRQATDDMGGESGEVGLPGIVVPID